MHDQWFSGGPAAKSRYDFEFCFRGRASARDESRLTSKPHPTEDAVELFALALVFGRIQDAVNYIKQFVGRKGLGEEIHPGILSSVLDQPVLYIP